MSRHERAVAAKGAADEFDELHDDHVRALVALAETRRALAETYAELAREQERLNSIRAALDGRHLCFGCAGPRRHHGDMDHGHESCEHCAGTLCAPCCAMRVVP